MRRAAAILLGLVMGANGLVMLAVGAWWYGVVPGVTETGPFNPHFVKDIGADYLVTGAAFGWLAARPSALAHGAAGAGAAFLLIHGAVHLIEAVGDAHVLADLARDFPGVLAPALIAAWVVQATWPRPEPDHAQSPA
jgi:hypothetical protein